MRRQIERTLWILLGLGVAVIPIHSQTKTQKPSFEVVSIKPTPPGSDRWLVTPPQGDRQTMSGVTLKTLMAMAYRDSTGYELEVFGGPDWLDSARYEVHVKADCSGGIISRDQQSLMMQSLLEERFQLKAHVETRDMPIYNLVVGKDGPKLKASADQTPPPQLIPASPLCSPTVEPLKLPALPPLPATGTDPSRFISQMPRGATFLNAAQQGALTLQGGAVSITRLVFILRSLTTRQVIDKTGLTDLYDISMKFSTDGLTVMGRPVGVTAAVAEDPAPTLFSAIQDLGLKLEQTRGPVQVVVIDSAQKPSEN